MIKAFIFTLFISQIFSLTFNNETKCEGKLCPLQAKNIKFDGYTLIVDVVYNGGDELFGGEVTLLAEFKFLGLFWQVGYEGTDPTCSYEGTDCENGYLFSGSEKQKTLKLTLGDIVPPSGTYRGTATFYNLNENDTQAKNYAAISMNWNCDSSKCF